MTGTNAGVEFNFSFAPDVTEEQALGFLIAGDLWSKHLADSYQGEDLEINIYVEATDEYLPDNIVGGAFPAIATNTKYRDIYDGIQNDVTTDADQIVADNLLDQNKIDVLVGQEVIDKNFKTHVTTANLKALGLLAGDNSELDGYILINNLDGELWNYDYLGAPQEGTLDFLSMAQHEIGHVLGFISGANHTEETVGNRITNMTTMDLFRYSTNSLELGINDLTHGEAAFFSIDGQESTLELTTGEDYQIGHLAHSDANALMSPTISLGKRWSITGDDLSVLDAIGWDVVNPEVIDMAAIYADALTEAESVQFANRQSEVEEYILSGNAYNWGSGAWGGGWWWGSGAWGGGWWQERDFIELETMTEEIVDDHYHSHEEDYTHEDSLAIEKVIKEDHDHNREDSSAKLQEVMKKVNDLLRDYWNDDFWSKDSEGDNSHRNRSRRYRS